MRKIGKADLGLALVYAHWKLTERGLDLGQLTRLTLDSGLSDMEDRGNGVKGWNGAFKCARTEGLVDVSAGRAELRRRPGDEGDVIAVDGSDLQGHVLPPIGGDDASEAGPRRVDVDDGPVKTEVRVGREEVVVHPQLVESVGHPLFQVQDGGVDTPPIARLTGAPGPKTHGSTDTDPSLVL